MQPKSQRSSLVNNALPQKNPFMLLYEPMQVQRVLSEIIPDLGTRAHNQSENALIALATRLSGRSPYRAMLGTRNHRWEIIEASLRKSFPHFAAVIDIIRDAWYLAHLSGTSLQIPPLLLLGDAGLGKTFFVARLAKLLGSEYRFIPMSTTTAGFVLSGMSMSWADARPGLVFTHLLHGNQGNPLLLLDEVDKASSGYTQDALGPLYGLLERHTAGEFKDEYFPVALNAAQVQWIATANTLDPIPDPIRSRMQVVTVRHPTLTERQQLTRLIYSDLLESQPWGHIFDESLDRGIQDAVAESCKTPREIRKALERMCGATATGFSRMSIDTDPAQELRPTVCDLPRLEKPRAPFGFSAGVQISGEKARIGTDRQSRKVQSR